MAVKQPKGLEWLDDAYFLQTEFDVFNWYKYLSRLRPSEFVRQHLGPKTGDLKSFAQINPDSDIEKFSTPWGIAAAFNRVHQEMRHYARQLSKFLIQNGVEMDFERGGCPFAQASKLNDKNGFKLKLGEHKIHLEGYGIEAKAVFLGEIADGFFSRGEVSQQHKILASLFGENGAGNVLREAGKITDAIDSKLEIHGDSLAEHGIVLNTALIAKKMEENKASFRAIYNLFFTTQIMGSDPPEQMMLWINPDNVAFFTETPLDIACMLYAASVSVNCVTSENLQESLKTLSEKVAQCGNNQKVALLLNEYENQMILEELDAVFFPDDRFKIFTMVDDFIKNNLAASRGGGGPRLQ